MPAPLLTLLVGWSLASPANLASAAPPEDSSIEPSSDAAPTASPLQWETVPPTTAESTASNSDPSTAPRRRKRRRLRSADDLEGLNLLPRLSLAANLNAFSTVIRSGAGATVFVFRGLGFGLETDYTAILYREGTRIEHPGIENALPRHVVEIMPQLWWVAMPQELFSPYLRAAIGPVIHAPSSASTRVLGKWAVGAGVIFDVDGFWLDIGANFVSQFPDARYRELWTYGEVGPFCGLIGTPCAMRLEPRFGVGYAFAIEGP